ncbi:TIGR02444 family protein [Caulobacter sp. NIBR2454]|uniref:TIGR02444 family protein n=1 Tax=Caulobacter sp. NIBR2454 TaxID=3015996 RepID=UPI0022B6CDF1|nr:TIGR02444 family protein [Caulobacter sp. NIBR2454]
MSLWAWAVKAYGREGVGDLCVDLQDAHGQSVPYLLFAAWAALEGRRVEAVRAVALARAWEAEVVSPLRAVRRRLKQELPGTADAARWALREQVKGVELGAERLLLEGLETLAGEPGAARPLGQALSAASLAFGGAPEAKISRLATLLS